MSATSDPARRLLICSCEDTMPLDADCYPPELPVRDDVGDPALRRRA